MVEKLHDFRAYARNSANAVIYGAGGHAAELASHLQRDGWSVLCFIDDFQNGIETSGISVVSFEVAQVQFSNADWFVAIGDSGARKTMTNKIVELGLPLGTYVSADAWVAGNSLIGTGVQVFARSVVSVRVQLGRGTIVNFGSVLSHDVETGEFVTISPGVHVAGHVRIGAGAFLGVGASVRNGEKGRKLVIGSGSIVGAGACVVGDVDEGKVVVGCPARPLLVD